MKIRDILGTACALLILASAAQAQTLSGKWLAEYPSRIRMENGTAAAETMGQAVLTIEQKGDSVFGSWLAINTPVASPPRTIVGVVKAGHLEFASSPIEARMRRSMNDPPESEEKVMMRTIYEGTVAGDAITGTMYSKTDDGSVTSSSLKWTAKREGK